MQNTKKFIGMFSFGSTIIEFQEEKEKLFFYLENDTLLSVMMHFLNKGITPDKYQDLLIIEYKGTEVEIPDFLNEIELPVKNLTQYFGSGVYHGETIVEPEIEEVGHV